MRFLVMVKANKDSEAGKLPDEKLIVAMGKLNDEMIKAGVLLSGEGLQPSSKGSRVTFSGAERSVVDGPFAETKELIGGFWILQAKSKAEVIEWVKRVPFDSGEEIEIRQISEAADFEPAIKTPEGAATLAAETAFRAKQAKR